jgi:hypothetical protein
VLNELAEDRIRGHSEVLILNYSLNKIKEYSEYSEYPPTACNYSKNIAENGIKIGIALKSIMMGIVKDFSLIY